MAQIAFSEAAQRNRGPILEVLRRVLPEHGRVLEIASGTGQHVAYFAGELPHLHWLPSEPDLEMHAAIQAHVKAADLTNVDAPLALDVMEDWPDISVDAVIVANLLHISPAATLPSLCDGAARVCRAGGVLHIYGPFKQGGEHTAASNAQFDLSLRDRNASWGLRDVEKVIEVAHTCGFELIEHNDMPANNFSLVFRRTG